jgi:ATP-dependent exoDNAse (exonuclease V) beta subunit
MDYKEQVFSYIVDIEDDKASEIILESEFRELYEDVVMTDFDEWDIVSFQILIKGKFLEDLDEKYKSEKAKIEKALIKFAETEKKSVRNISWLPLPRILSKISEYNQNDKMKQYLIENSFDYFFRDVKSIFASMSYNMKVTEAYFHSNIHTLLKVLGFNIESEDETNIGRIDSVIEFTDKIIIMEFKTSSSEIALSQIKQKKYYEKYLLKAKEIYLIGVSCNLNERNINEWQSEKYDA